MASARALQLGGLAAADLQPERQRAGGMEKQPARGLADGPRSVTLAAGGRAIFAKATEEEETKSCSSNVGRLLSVWVTRWQP